MKTIDELWDQHKKMHWYLEYAEDGIINKSDLIKIIKVINNNQLESSAIQKIAEVVKNKKQKYLDWLKLPRYQEETSDEYYADIQAITEDLQKVIDFIDSNFGNKVK